MTSFALINTSTMQSTTASSFAPIPSTVMGGVSTVDPFLNRGSNVYSTLLFRARLYESALKSHKGIGSDTTEYALSDASYRYGNKTLQQLKYYCFYCSPRETTLPNLHPPSLMQANMICE